MRQVGGVEFFISERDRVGFTSNGTASGIQQSITSISAGSIAGFTLEQVRRHATQS